MKLPPLDYIWNVEHDFPWSWKLLFLKLYIVIISHCTFQKVSMVLKFCLFYQALKFFKKITRQQNKIIFLSLESYLYLEKILLAKQKTWDNFRDNV